MDLAGIPLLPAAPGWTTNYGLSVILELMPTLPGAWTVGNEYSVLGLCVDNATTPPTGYAITVDDADHFRLVPLANVKLNRPAP
jgi:hypothetical protein